MQFGTFTFFVYSLYNPICLHPDLTTRQVLKPFAVYPLLLIFITLTLRHNNFAFVVWLSIGGHFTGALLSSEDSGTYVVPLSMLIIVLPCVLLIPFILSNLFRTFSIVAFFNPNLLLHLLQREAEQLLELVLTEVMILVEY